MKAIELSLIIDNLWELVSEYPSESIGHGEAARLVFDDESTLLTPDPSTLLPPHPEPITEPE